MSGVARQSHSWTSSGRVAIRLRSVPPSFGGGGAGGGGGGGFGSGGSSGGGASGGGSFGSGGGGRTGGSGAGHHPIPKYLGGNNIIISSHTLIYHSPCILTFTTC